MALDVLAESVIPGNPSSDTFNVDRPRQLPQQVWGPLNELLGWAMWFSMIAAIVALIISAVTWGWQYKYPHFNTAVAPVKLIQIGICCAVLSAVSGITNAVLA